MENQVTMSDLLQRLDIHTELHQQETALNMEMVETLKDLVAQQRTQASLLEKVAQWIATHPK